ncbi:hypothetical protein [Pseudooceanicola onchidii]|uniref:COG3904 family protein n=1 Tax=Pseudooceanicola onchidii TaxID=2562279 RepID=UPI0010A9D159|nr:hypothetical protein [Pseudooceanicola onchidii]
MMNDQEKLRPIRRMLTGVLAFQLVLAGFLFLGDMGRDFSWPSRDPSAPGFDQPVRPGDQRREYDPRLPTAPGTQIDGPMPERLVLQPLDDGRALLTGKIGAGDADRIVTQITASEAEEIVLHSPGGNVADALEVGRAIRTAGKRTALRASDVCLSACPYMLAGGTERTVAEGGRVGVHQHYFGENTFLPAFMAVRDIQRGQAEVMRHLDEMGVDPMVLVPGLSTPPEAIYILTPEELSETRLANG